MKKAWALGLFACALGLLAGCAGDEKKQTLHLYTWADYVSPDMVAQFEKDNNCTVVIDTFDSNEAVYAKLKAGATGYDLITPTNYMVAILAKQGMLQKLDHAKLPNMVNLDGAYQKFSGDPSYAYNVPYMFGSAGITYRKDLVTNFEPSYAMFDRADLKGKMVMLDDPRETIGMALKSLGYSLNTTDDAQLAQAGDVVIRWKKNLAKFDNEQYKNGIASGEFSVAVGYSGDVRQVMAEQKDVTYVAAKEGIPLQVDEFVIPVGAPNADLAHKYIDFMHRPDVAAANMMFVFYLCPNKVAYDKLPPDFKADPTVFLPADVLAKSESILDLGELNKKYTALWDKIKAAQ